MGNLSASVMKIFILFFFPHQTRLDGLLHNSNSSERPNFCPGSIQNGGGGGGEAAAVYSSFTSLPLTIYEGSSVEPTLAGSEASGSICPLPQRERQKCSVDPKSIFLRGGGGAFI